MNMQQGKSTSPQNDRQGLPDHQPNCTIYFISGLGADERVFHRLQLAGFRAVHIHWEPPQQGEQLDHYARRLKGQIRTEHPILVGLSFGGLVAIEIAKQSDPTQVILLSSIKTAKEIPIYFRLFRWLPVHFVVPFKQLLWAVYWFIYWLFDLGTQQERELLKQILRDTDPVFLRWAMQRVVTWQNHEVPDNLVHVHGSRDRVFPPRNLAADVMVEKGGHLMVLNRAEQISRLLVSLLQTRPTTAVSTNR
jgi:pimeloyl-ACP methyl ester carboxylesterase